MVEYIAKEWETLIIGYPEKEVVQSWELLDENNLSVIGVDLAIQPFTEKAYVVSTDKKLYIYDLSEEMVSGVNNLKGKKLVCICSPAKCHGNIICEYLDKGITNE
jgi:hypothetical protein